MTIRVPFNIQTRLGEPIQRTIFPDGTQAVIWWTAVDGAVQAQIAFVPPGTLVELALDISISKVNRTGMEIQPNELGVFEQLATRVTADLNNNGVINRTRIYEGETYKTYPTIRIDKLIQGLIEVNFGKTQGADLHSYDIFLGMTGTYTYVPNGILKIDSVPQGKTGTIKYLDTNDTYPFTTPWLTEHAVGVQAEISINPQDFQQWNDGNTDNPRTVTYQEGTLRIIAEYQRTGTMWAFSPVGPDKASVTMSRGEYVATFDIPNAMKLDPPTDVYVAALDPEGWTFSHWIDHTNKQWDTRMIGPLSATPLSINYFEVYYTKTGGDGGNWLLPALGIGFLGMIALYFLMRPQKRKLK